MNPRLLNLLPYLQSWDGKSLNFRLLSDPDGKIVDAYGVQVAGRKMARRVSFLIGLDGKIVHVTDAGDPDVHFNEMKTAIADLKKK